MLWKHHSGTCQAPHCSKSFRGLAWYFNSFPKSSKSRPTFVSTNAPLVAKSPYYLFSPYPNSFTQHDSNFFETSKINFIAISQSFPFDLRILGQIQVPYFKPDLLLFSMTVRSTILDYFILFFLPDLVIQIIIFCTVVAAVQNATGTLLASNPEKSISGDVTGKQMTYLLKIHFIFIIRKCFQRAIYRCLLIDLYSHCCFFSSPPPSFFLSLVNTVDNELQNIMLVCCVSMF